MRRVRPFKPMNEAALDLYEAIGGEAFKDVEYMPIGELDCATGIANIIERLRPCYEEKEISKKAVLLNSYEALRRQRGEHVRAYVNRYIRVEGNLMDVGINVHATLPGAARAHQLLAKAMLPAEGLRNVLSTAGQVFNFDRVRDAMCLLYADNRPASALYDQFDGKEFGTRQANPQPAAGKPSGKAGGKGAGRPWQQQQPRRVNLVEHGDDGAGEEGEDGGDEAAGAAEDDHADAADEAADDQDNEDGATK
jgi:hypothetical protein